MKQSRRQLIFFLLLSIFLWHQTAQGEEAWEWVSLQSSVSEPIKNATHLDVEQQKGGHALRIHITLDGLWRKAHAFDGAHYHQYRIDHEGQLQTLGRPALPSIGRLIAIPKGASVTLEIESKRERRFVTLPPYPKQPKRKRGEAEQSFAFMKDSAIYSEKGLYPKRQAWLERGLTFREIQLVRLVVLPLQYDAEKKEMSAIERITLRLQFDKPYEASKPIALPAGFDALYRKHILASEAILAEPPAAYHPPAGILAIVADEFLGALSSYAEWKRDEGYALHITPVSEAGQSEEVLADFIRQYYRAADTPPIALWLVGDHGEVPTIVGMQNCDADFLYTLIEGADYLPEMAVGRFSAQSLSLLLPQLEKALSYQKTPPVGADAEYFKRALLISSSEGFQPSDDERLDTLGATLLENGYEILPLYHSTYEDTAENIFNAFNQGQGLAVYMGHGNGVEWMTTRPAFGTEEIAELTNAEKYPFIMDVSCTNGSFRQLEPCFAERWMQSEAKGAVGIYSASTPTPWEESAFLGERMTSLLSENGGRIINAKLGAILDLVAHFGETSDAVETLQQYVFFGDPTLSFRTKRPETLTARLPERLTEATSFPASVYQNGAPKAGASIAVHRGGQSLVFQTDAHGQATCLLPQVDESSDASRAKVVITSGDAMPLYRSISIEALDCGTLQAMPPVTRCDGDISLTLISAQRNQDENAMETVGVMAQSDTFNEILTLTETAEDSGEFAGRFSVANLHPSAADGERFFFYLAEMGCERAREASASILLDCKAPELIAPPEATPADFSALIAWETDEPSVAAARLEAGAIVESSEFAFNHSVTFAHLASETTYRYRLEAEDEAGNRAIFDNDGAWFSLTTLACIPQCEGKQCGRDACGGSCGECPEHNICVEEGRCVYYCEADCVGKECGDDGCGSLCGLCDAEEICTDAGLCEPLCLADCAGKECGDDGCGGDCGLCDDGESCTEAGLCVEDMPLVDGDEEAAEAAEWAERTEDERGEQADWVYEPEEEIMENAQDGERAPNEKNDASGCRQTGGVRFAFSLPLLLLLIGVVRPSVRLM